MTDHGFALFDTALGRCGIAWSRDGITRLQLPEADEGRTLQRLADTARGGSRCAPPPRVRRAVAGIVRHLLGEPGALPAVALDMSGVPPFRRQVYEAARAISPGETLTYGALAQRIGRPGDARAVGRALGHNPFALLVPCHRVVSAGGRPGGFSASGGVTTKPGLLAIERARPDAAPGRPHARSGAGSGGGSGGGAGSVFAFDTGLAPAYVRASDPGLAPLIDEVGPFVMPLNAGATVFGMLAEALVHQQLTTGAAATIFGRVCALFPQTSQGLLPEQVGSACDAQLRGAGLSRAKTAALRDLAERADSGRLPGLEAISVMDDEAVVECLTSVRGIGRWTAQMFLMFRLGRADVLPLGDYGLRNGFALAFGRTSLPQAAEIEERAALWRPYRTVACWYLWQAVERAKRGPSA